MRTRSYFFSVLLFLGVLLSQAAASSFTELNKPGELLDGRGRAVVVEGVLPGRAAEVFNLEVAHTHNFLVSDAGILVHNNCRDRKSARPEGVPDKPVGGLGRKLNDKWLKSHGVDPHDVKGGLPGNPSRFDLYKDKAGNLWAQSKSGQGEAQFIGNLDDFKI